MKGLLIKDFCLLKNQKTILPIFLAIGILYAGLYDAAFGVTFLGMIGALTSVGTISYDDFDHGNSFLFTLPFTRKTYVKEKYLLCMLGALAGCVFAVICGVAASFIKKTPTSLSELPLIFVVSLFLALLVGSLMIPLRIRFGTEKGKLVGLLTGGVLAVLIILLAKAMPDAEMDQFLAQVNYLTLGIGAAAAVLLFAFFSYRITLRWLSKMEF